VSALTPREREVLASAAAGKAIKQTALELYMAESTVRKHRADVCRKARVRNFLEAVYLYGRGELH
jgi:DNA-binding CsgD family transcriptional regulator